MVHRKRGGYKYQIRKCYIEYLDGTVYHPPLIDSRYWEDPTFVNKEPTTINVTPSKKSTLVNRTLASRSANNISESQLTKHKDSKPVIVNNTLIPFNFYRLLNNRRDDVIKPPTKKEEEVPSEQPSVDPTD